MKIKNINEEYKELETRHNIINISFGVLKEKEREVIECLYINGTIGFKSLLEVGIKINMSKANISKLRKTALEIFLDGRL